MPGWEEHPGKRHLTLTPTLLVSLVDTSTGDQDIMDNRKDAFTTDIVSVAVLDSGVMQNGSFVQHHAPAMNTSSKGDFIGMKVIEA